MKKRIFPILIIAAILLAACSKTKEGSQIAEPIATAVVEGEKADEPNDENGDPQQGPFTDVDNPCKPFSLIGQKLVAPFPGLPPVSEDDWVVGPDDAVVTFMEYSELQCPFCAQLEPQLNDVQKLFPDDVRLVFRHRPFPVSFHDKSILAAQAMEAAGKQGKFHEFKNFMFDRQGRNPGNPEHANLPDDAFWSSVAKDDFDAWLEKNIGILELDPSQFFKDMYSKEIEKKVEEAADSADSLGINGTPKLFINGSEWQENDRSVRVFSIYVQLIKKQKNEYDKCAPTVIESGKNYSATISTTKGDIVVDLFADIAPTTVNSFVFLAQEGWYDGLPFMATDEFVITGDPSDTGYGGPGYAYLDELSDDYASNIAGRLVTFALPGMNGSIFFIIKNNLENPLERPTFGEVVEGMDVVNALESREFVVEPAIDRILSITINES